MLSTRHSVILLGPILVLVILLNACSDDPVAPEPPAPPVEQLVISELPRDMSPEVPPEDLDQLSAGNREFTVKFFKETTAEQNLIFSPLSLRQGMVLQYAGARGQTAVEMDHALCYGLDQSALHPAMNARNLILAGRNNPGEGHWPSLDLIMANSLWSPRGFEFVPDYLDLLAVNYGAGVHTVDFENAPEQCRGLINDWVAEETGDRILELLPSGSIDGRTSTVLVNTLNFEAAWVSPFKPEDTTEDPFTLLDGTTTTVSMLKSSIGDFRYYEDDECQAARLYFYEESWSLAMVLILPGPGQFQTFVDELDTAKLDQILSGFSYDGVFLALPKFTFDFECPLNETMQSLGMHLAFDDEAADFSGMTNEDIRIDQSYHRTSISVDEIGVAMAAATVEIDAPVGLPQNSFVADRPFLFLIRDWRTDTILFFGQVVDPSL